MQFTDQVKLALHAIAQPSRPLSTLHGRIQKRAGTLQIVSTSFLIYSTGTRNILQNPLRNRMIRYDPPMYVHYIMVFNGF